MIIGGRGGILSMVLTKGNNFVLGWGVQYSVIILGFMKEKKRFWNL